MVVMIESRAWLRASQGLRMRCGTTCRLTVRRASILSNFGQPRRAFLSVNDRSVARLAEHASLTLNELPCRQPERITASPVDAPRCDEGCAARSQ